ncbi:MAG: ORF6N domain-containing protein [Bacteroidales bacterium]|nr:ORF6N domain-containing protein [Bacteroidales bacterium]
MIKKKGNHSGKPISHDNQFSEMVSSYDQIENMDINTLIHNIRGQQIILDRDLAMLYGVETRKLNQSVKRNINRFPIDFMFQLNTMEWNYIKSHDIASKKLTIKNIPF